MLKNVLYLFTLLVMMNLIVACNSDSEEASFDLNISGLEDLGSDFVYEGWLIVDGNAITTGTFTVDENGMLSDDSFTVMTEDLENASTFVLTIEPSPDSDPSPSKVHILSGDFVDNSADLSIAHGASLNNTFETVSGKYILATPSDDDGENESSGVWFLDNSSGSPEAGLNLPTLPEGWIYEGWAVINGTAVSTGTFSAVDMADNDASFSGVNGTPPFPGEDFLMNAPAGLTFPTDLSGGMAVISIEPVPDNSPAPFALKPLVGPIDANAAVHSVYEMNQNLSFPVGMVNR